jgi:hypothetical protein
MKNLYLSLFFSLSFLHVVAQQEKCGFTSYLNYRAASDPHYLARVAETKELIANHANNSIRNDESIITIPIVIHILYNTADQNISDDLVLDQVSVLNRDFRRLNEDTTLTRSEFLNVAADTRIEFVLASLDPEGNSTTGITRTQTNRTTFASLTGLDEMKSTATGGVNAWPVDQYLNIWVCNLSIFGIPFILGFATPPEGAPNWEPGSSANPASNDGVVVHYEVFGSRPNATGALAAVNKGRTAVHEVGHFLGLRHIWGDPGFGADGCAVDDGLSDTPNCASAQSQTCNYAANTCEDDFGIDFPDMLENYMDYSEEACMNMFSKQQSDAMRFVLENLRPGLLLHSKQASHQHEFDIVLWPVPSMNYLNVKIHGNISESSQIIVRNLSGMSIFEGEMKKNYEQFNFSELSSGTYIIEVKQRESSKFCRFIKH